MLLNNENKKSKRIKIKKKIINEFCYILCFMVINNNFLEYIFFLQKNFARNLLKIYFFVMKYIQYLRYMSLHSTIWISLDFITKKDRS